MNLKSESEKWIQKVQPKTGIQKGLCVGIEIVAEAEQKQIKLQLAEPV